MHDPRQEHLDQTNQGEALRASEKARILSEQLLDNMAVGFSVVDAEGREQIVNKALCRMTGFSEAELIGGRPPFRYWPEEELASIQAAFEQTLSSGHGDYELTLKRKNGERFPVQVSTGALRDADGRISHFYANLIEITDRRKAERQLDRALAFLEQTSQVARVGGWELDLINNALEWTGAIRDIHEVPRDFEPTYEEVIKFYTPESRGRLEEAIGRAIEDGTPYDVEVQIITALGKELWVRAIGNAEFRDGRCIRLFGTFQDIDEARKIREALEQAKVEADAANRAKSDFLANMSHEIRTPLNSVIGFTDLLRQSRLDEQQRQYVRYVHQSANSLLDLLNDILDFSKIEAGKLELSVDKTDLWELTNHIVDIIRYKTNEKGLELLLNIAPEVPRIIHADPIRLRQVLINLLGNAIKFTKEGFIRIDITAAPGPSAGTSRLYFAVSDSGCGISPEHQQRIFDAFTQEDASTTRKFGGTGLGLSISNRLLHLMNSRLEVDSEPGRGSTFSFRVCFPSEGGSDEDRLADQARLKAIGMVLVVDDNAQNSEILREMLARAEVPCTCVDNGLAALTWLQQHSAEIAIIDYQMPFMDGLEVIGKIRRELQLSPESLRILLLHSLTDDAQVRAQARALGIHRLANKPIDSRQLFSLLIDMQGGAAAQPETAASGSVGAEGLAPGGATVAATIGAPPAAVRILLVDDHVLNLTLARHMIADALPQARIEEASGGSEAIQAFIANPPDLVLMDVQMPGVNGYEATREIRAWEDRQAREGLEQVPIIALTAGTLKGERDRCLAAGMNDYLPKPVTSEQLRACLSQWLGVPLATPNGADATEASATAMPAPPAAINESRHFNRDGLLRRVGGNQQTVDEFLGMMDQDTFTGRLDELGPLIRAGSGAGADLAAIRALAHRIRGIAANGSFEHMASLADQLEQLQPFDAETATRLVEAMREEDAHIRRLLQAQ